MNPKKLALADKAELRQMLLAGITLDECATWFDCSRSTILRAQRDIIAKFGPIHRRGREQYTRWHLTHRTPQSSESSSGVS